MVWGFLAEALVLVHGLFVVFALGGGFLLLKWPRVAWLHLPAVVWSVWVEWAGWFCPLTPLEIEWRRRAGQAGYEGDFVAHYLLPLLYPQGLTRGVQWFLGGMVLAVNVGVYVWVWRRGRKA